MKKLQKQTEEVLLPIEEIVPVSDLGCASALQTAGFELLALDRQNPHKIKFVFRREAGIEKVADDFWSDRLEQKSRSFWDNIKNLKNRIYSE
jgi:hypothetical protein